MRVSVYMILLDKINGKGNLWNIDLVQYCIADVAHSLENILFLALLLVLKSRYEDLLHVHVHKIVKNIFSKPMRLTNYF